MNERNVEKKTISLRVSGEINDWLEQKAKAGYRTVSAQIRLFLEAEKRKEEAKGVAQ